jgi:hypothetical protein
MCWFHPEEESKRLIKDCCVKIVDEIKRLEKIGDPIGCTLRDAQELLEHLYDPNQCILRKNNCNHVK